VFRTSKHVSLKRPDLRKCALLLGGDKFLRCFPHVSYASSLCLLAVTETFAAAITCFHSEWAANAHQSDDGTEVALYEKATDFSAPSLTLCIVLIERLVIHVGYGGNWTLSQRLTHFSVSSFRSLSGIFSSRIVSDTLTVEL
jgi:hypothetical protein